MAISAGTYQLISSLDNGFVGTTSATRGAFVGDWYADDATNLCKFDLTIISGTTCALTLCEGGNGLVYNTSQYAGSYVKLAAADSSNTLQRWDFTQVTTATYRGVTCGVYNIQPNSDATLFLTSSSVGSHLGGVSVEAAKTDATGIQGQLWIAYPTKPTDAGLVVPDILGWAETVGGEGAYSRDAAATLYPVWDGGYSWGESTSNYWQGCTRYQTLDGITGTWGEWSDYTAWAPLTATRADNLYWLTAGLDANVTGAKAKRYQIQIRAVGVDSGSETYGYPATATLTANVVPTVTITAATFGPLGLALAFTSDYVSGTNFIEFNVYDAVGGKLSLFNSVRSFTGGSYTAIVSPDKLNDWIEEDEEITILYAVGTDEYRGWYNDAETHEATLTVGYDGGSGVTLAPVVTMGAGRLLNVSVGSSLPNEAVYVRSGGRLVQATKNGDGSFSCVYPFASDFEVYAVAYNDAMTAWGTWEETFTPQSQLLKAYPACHAWSWAGGSFLLEVTSDIMETDRKIDTTNEIVTLDSREYQSVLFSKTLESRYTADGILKHGLTESDKGQLLALLGVKHAYYRAPHGDVANVAITGVSYVDRRSFTEVTVDMMQETR